MPDSGLPQIANPPVATQVIYDASSNPIYVGTAAPGTATNAAAWQIQKLTYDASGDLLSRTWAGGSASYTNIWNNYASLSYS